MAFRKNRDSGTVTLTFGDDSDYPGLTVVLRKMSVSAWLETLGAANDAEQNGGVATIPGLLGGIQIAVRHLVSWDLEEEDGSPVPITAALDQDKDMLTDIYAGWLNGSVGVPAPLEQSSPDGPHSDQVLSLPAETLSPSPES